MGLKAFDTLSDRKDLYCLLDRLSRGVSVWEGNRRRKRLLADFCRELSFARQAVLGDGTAGETYALLVSLSSQFGLDLERVAVWVEERVRGVGPGR